MSLRWLIPLSKGDDAASSCTSPAGRTAATLGAAILPSAVLGLCKGHEHHHGSPIPAAGEAQHGQPRQSQMRECEMQLRGTVARCQLVLACSKPHSGSVIYVQHRYIAPVGRNSCILRGISIRHMGRDARGLQQRQEGHSDKAQHLVDSSRAVCIQDASCPARALPQRLPLAVSQPGFTSGPKHRHLPAWS